MQEPPKFFTPASPDVPSRSKRRIVVLGLLGGIIVVVCLAVCASLVFLRPQLARLFTQPIPTLSATLISANRNETQPSPLVTQPILTPQCVEPTLVLGTSKFRVASAPRDANSYPSIPPGSPDMAYWVAGTTVNYVFGLSPVGNNLALKDILKAGDPATISWADCSTDEYIVDSIEALQPGDMTIFDQSSGGITVFVQTDLPSAGFVIRGERPETQAAETPSPTEANATQAEISFLDQTTSPDGTTLKLTIDIKNTGPIAFTISTSDISLTVENAAPLAPLSVEPALPLEIQPGESKTISITFPKPTVATAVFKMLDFSVDIFF